jgi:hypothetical protein
MGKGYVILPNVFVAHKGVAIKEKALLPSYAALEKASL